MSTYLNMHGVQDKKLKMTFKVPDVVINPKTGREILVRGAEFKNILKQGYYLDPKTYQLKYNPEESVDARYNNVLEGIKSKNGEIIIRDVVKQLYETRDVNGFRVVSLDILENIEERMEHYNPAMRFSPPNFWFLLISEPYQLCRYEIVTFERAVKIAKVIRHKHFDNMIESYTEHLFEKTLCCDMQQHNENCRKICSKYAIEIANIVKEVGYTIPNEFVKGNYFNKFMIASACGRYKIPKYVYELETNILECIQSINGVKSLLPNDSYILQRKIEDFCEIKGYTLGSSQKDGLTQLIESDNLICLYGLPGSGKTTILKIYKSYCDHFNLGIIFCALSGKAVSNIIVNVYDNVTSRNIDLDIGNERDRQNTTVYKDATYIESGKTVGTIHKVFSDITKLKGVKVIVVDESSMIDYDIFTQILRYVKHHFCKLILVGDPLQLPPIGKGCLFADMINMYVGKIDQIKLQGVYRQKEGNLLSTINSFYFNNFNINTHINREKDGTTGGCYLYESSTNDIIKTVDSIINKLHVNISDVMILCASKKPADVLNNHSGAVGVDLYMLNKHIQDTYIPSEEYVNIKSQHRFKIGDILLRLKNKYPCNPDEDVEYNGDMYVIHSIDGYTVTLIRTRDKKQFVVNAYELRNKKVWTLSYAITVHKSQGSQSPYVIVIMPEAHSYMWYTAGRKLLYTAISRAKNECHIIGMERFLQSVYDSNKDILSGFNLGLHSINKK